MKTYTMILDAFGAGMCYHWFLNEDTGEVDWDGLKYAPTLLQERIASVHTPQQFKDMYPDYPYWDPKWSEFVQDWENSVAQFQKNLRHIVLPEINNE